MKFLKSISNILVLFIAFNSFSQEQQKEIHLYFDENGNTIEFYNYLKKCGSFLYHCKKTQKDSIYINKINELFKFGKLSETELFQLNNLLDRDTKSSNLNNKTVVINFRDTLFGYPTLKKRMDSLTIAHNHNHKISNSKYSRDRRTFDNSRKKCHKKYRKENIKPLYFFRHNKDYNYINKNFEWHKLSKSLNALFFKTQHSSIVILKPDGNYFYYHNIPDSYVEELLKNNWDQYIKDYNIAKNNLLKERNGFFKDMEYSYQESRKKLDQKFEPNKLAPLNSVLKINRHGESYYRLKQPINCFSYGSY